jgi:hypothetical protein
VTAVGRTQTSETQDSREVEARSARHMAGRLNETAPTHRWPGKTPAQAGTSVAPRLSCGPFTVVLTFTNTLPCGTVAAIDNYRRASLRLPVPRGRPHLAAT